jgi:hypothetical protein
MVVAFMSLISMDNCMSLNVMLCIISAFRIGIINFELGHFSNGVT